MGVTLVELIPILQIAVGPVILISGFGLLLLSMTNRYGRVIDRARELIQDLRRDGETERVRLLAEVQLLYRRARVIRVTIFFAIGSVILAATLIITLFLTALFKWEIALLISLIFILCMASLMVSLGLFIYDIQLSLSALKLEVESITKG